MVVASERVTMLRLRQSSRWRWPPGVYRKKLQTGSADAGGHRVSKFHRRLAKLDRKKWEKVRLRYWTEMVGGVGNVVGPVALRSITRSVWSARGAGLDLQTFRPYVEIATSARAPASTQPHLSGRHGRNWLLNVSRSDCYAIIKA